MKMCQKCGTFMAMPGSEFCASCNPLGINITQGQVGTGPQQQAQNVNAFGISVAQQQSQVAGGSQQQSFSAGGGGSNGEVLNKLNSLESGISEIKGDMTQVKEQLKKILENQIANYEYLSDKMDELTKRRNELNVQATQAESSGNFDKADEIQAQMQALRDEMKGLFANMQESLDIMSDNILRVLENQDLTEQFLKVHLQSDWEKVKDIWSDYKEGKINKKGLIKGVLKTVGVKVAKKLVSKFVPGIG